MLGEKQGVALGALLHLIRFFLVEDIGMNRTILFGVAIFFAFVAIALIGGDAQVIAGHGCHGCKGARKGARKCDGATATKTRCHGSKRSRGSKLCHGSKRCHGSKGCSGDSKATGEIAPPPPKETRAPRLRRAPLAVSYTHLTLPTKA